MQVRWRKNPKTEDGWIKRTAISLLAGLGAFLFSLPLTFALFLAHLNRTYPEDTQNFLGAITAAVLLGLFLALLCFCAAMILQFLFSFTRKKSAAEPELTEL
jgi:Zn-dependent protease with chaperone function